MLNRNCVKVLLMVQKSGYHQLRLVVYPSIYDGFYASKRWLSSLECSGSPRLKKDGMVLELLPHLADDRESVKATRRMSSKLELLQVKCVVEQLFNKPEGNLA